MDSLERTTFVPDIHSDCRALEDSLMHARCADRKRSGITVHDGERIVQTGDLPDRFGEFFPVLDTLLAVRDRAKLTLLAGNHDVMMLDALFHPDQPDQVFRWVRGANGGYAVLREIARREKLTLRHPVSDALEIFPAGRTRLRTMEPGQALTLTLDWDKTVRDHRLGRYDLPTAFEHARELLLQEPYMTLFREMKLAHEVAGCILAIHAGVEQTLAKKGAEYVNSLWEVMVRWKNFEPLKYGESLSPLIWARREMQPRKKLFSKEIAARLRADGKCIVIHSHNIRGNGRQKNLPCYGVRDMNGDVGMSRGCTESPATWGYIQLQEDGHIIAASSAGGEQDFGRIEQGKYQKHQR